MAERAAFCLGPPLRSGGRRVQRQGFRPGRQRRPARPGGREDAARGRQQERQVRGRVSSRLRVLCLRAGRWAARPLGRGRPAGSRAFRAGSANVRCPTLSVVVPRLRPARGHSASRSLCRYPEVPVAVAASSRQASQLRAPPSLSLSLLPSPFSSLLTFSPLFSLMRLFFYVQQTPPPRAPANAKLPPLGKVPMVLKAEGPQSFSGSQTGTPRPHKCSFRPPRAGHSLSAVPRVGWSPPESSCRASPRVSPRAPRPGGTTPSRSAGRCLAGARRARANYISRVRAAVTSPAGDGVHEELACARMRSAGERRRGGGAGWGLGASVSPHGGDTLRAPRDAEQHPRSAERRTGGLGRGHSLDAGASRRPAGCGGAPPAHVHPSAMARLGPLRPWSAPFWGSAAGLHWGPIDGVWLPVRDSQKSRRTLGTACLAQRLWGRGQRPLGRPEPSDPTRARPECGCHQVLGRLPALGKRVLSGSAQVTTQTSRRAAGLLGWGPPVLGGRERAARSPLGRTRVPAVLPAV